MIVAGVGVVLPVRVVDGVTDNFNNNNGKVVCGDNVGLPRCVDGDVTVGGDGDAVAILDGEFACDDVDFVIADGGDFRADDAGMVGMGRGSGARSRRLQILILHRVFFRELVGM